jgi:hypothetical protein
VPYRLKHLVIVHGIGDQQSNETVINFMNEFVRAMPPVVRDTVDIHNLVEQHDVAMDVERPAYLVLQDQGQGHVIAFSEVFWQPVTNEYLKVHHQPPIPIFPWAHSINTRLFKGGQDFRTAREAIDNLETMLNLFKRLATIYKKSGVLATILEKFLGDVEMYVESDSLRGKINDRFFQILESDQAVADEVLRQLTQMGQLDQTKWDSHEVYVVAHSEGTVVSYNCLVQAASDREGNPSVREWLLRVRGLVTLGSPLDKHYGIWNNRFVTDQLKTTSLNPRIRWFNYWDRSDPVGYGLAKLRPKDPSSDAFKMFDVQFDRTFARYPIPGMAHVEYWTDQDIHLDILQKAMGIGGPRPQEISSRWWGHEWLMRTVEVAAYCIGRAATLAAMLFFLMRLLDRVRPKVESLTAWVANLPGFPTSLPNGFGGWVAAIACLAAPVLLLKLWADLEARVDAYTSVGKVVRAIVLGGWLILLALALPDLKSTPGQYCCEQTGIKDYAGFALGLLVALLVWSLHTTVHKGIIQLWRYTGGEATAMEYTGANPEAPVGQASRPV